MYALIKFGNSDAKYTYLTDIEGLVEGDKVWVEAKGEEVKARFITYIPEIFVTTRPQARITSKRFIESPSETKIQKSSRTPQSELIAMSKIVVSFIRQTTLAQKWATKRDILNELADKGYENVSFDSVIKHARKYSNYVNQFQKNAYIYKKREEVM